MASANKSLVVVESPTKAKTIKKYLGKDCHVMASYGHVRDLLPKEGAVDPQQDFKMTYVPIEKNRKHVEAIAQALPSYDHLILAPDPDREGEAIAWHVQKLLEAKGKLRNKTVQRVVFHQITKKAIQEAMAHPREIDINLVNAQQARRALDYLVGFNLSPLLWRKIRAGLSAGRVQSPALRMIVERDIDIEQFIRKEYWTIHAENEINHQDFSAKLVQYAGEKVEQFRFVNEQQVKEALNVIKQATHGELLVDKVTKKQRKRHPAPPFTTSTLQQEAVRKLGFSASRTMQVAQQLYEGVDIGDGAIGLITYMRTDSLTLAKEALDEIRQLIQSRYGKKDLPDHPRVYKTKSKNTQEAHEAIRPTSVLRLPEELATYLSRDQLKLYRLIWKRTIACQMVSALLDTITVDLKADQHTFRAHGSTLIKPGFLEVYQEGFDDKKLEEMPDKLLPPMKEGEMVKVKDIQSSQHVTEPPPRYTEASLVKALEEHDIGRPSTYATIIAILKNRKYVGMENKRFRATDVGRVVNRFLTDYFYSIVDYDFTAHLENELDEIARGERGWIPTLEVFWQPFIEKVGQTDKTVKRSDVTQEKLDELCPKCQKLLSVRLGRSGRFIGCTGYPHCDYTRNLQDQSEDTVLLEKIQKRQCPKCQGALTIKHGRFGQFIGCSHYPNCRYIEPLEKPEDTHITCPQCQKGTLFKRKSHKAKVFYACHRYPNCDYAIWNPPIAEPCPHCLWPILMIKTTQHHGLQKVCPQKHCDYTIVHDETDNH